jgi:hypothetical protein
VGSANSCSLPFEDGHLVRIIILSAGHTSGKTTRVRCGDRAYPLGENDSLAGAVTPASREDSGHFRRDLPCPRYTSRSVSSARISISRFVFLGYSQAIVRPNSQNRLSSPFALCSPRTAPSGWWLWATHSPSIPLFCGSDTSAYSRALCRIGYRSVSYTCLVRLS